MRPKSNANQSDALWVGTYCWTKPEHLVSEYQVVRMPRLIQQLSYEEKWWEGRKVRREEMGTEEKKEEEEEEEEEDEEEEEEDRIG